MEGLRGSSCDRSNIVHDHVLTPIVNMPDHIASILDTLGEIVSSLHDGEGDERGIRSSPM